MAERAGLPRMHGDGVCAAVGSLHIFGASSLPVLTATPAIGW